MPRSLQHPTRMYGGGSRSATGIVALAAHPRRSGKRGEGERDVVVAFAGVAFRPGDFVYADADGLIVARTSLLR